MLEAHVAAASVASVAPMTARAAPDHGREQRDAVTAAAQQRRDCPVPRRARCPEARRALLECPVPGVSSESRWASHAFAADRAPPDQACSSSIFDLPDRPMYSGFDLLPRCPGLVSIGRTADREHGDHRQDAVRGLCVSRSPRGPTRAKPLAPRDALADRTPHGPAIARSERWVVPVAAASLRRVLAGPASPSTRVSKMLEPEWPLPDTFRSLGLPLPPAGARRLMTMSSSANRSPWALRCQTAEVTALPACCLCRPTQARRSATARIEPSCS